MNETFFLGRPMIRMRMVWEPSIRTRLVALAVPLILLLAGRLSGQDAARPPSAPKVDFSGVERFLDLTAILERDEEPPPEAWDRLFGTPGYAVLIQREFQRDFFEEGFRLAFMPSREEDLAKRLEADRAAGGLRSRYLPHFVRARSARDTIRWELENLRTLTFVDEAVEKAAVLLPSVDPGDYPPISFVIFGPDARGYSPVVIDVLHLRDRGDFLTSFVAHEFHHYYRNRLLRLTQDRDILWIIDQVQAEGIADQINVGEWFHDPDLFEEQAAQPRNRAYMEWYERSPEVIGRMDALFSEMSRHPEARGELGAELRDAVPLSGHPTGFFMANVIIDEMGTRALTEQIGNPFRFFLLYKEAADRRGGDVPTFSDPAVALIRELEARYLRRGTGA
jgi:hypothetical protein